MTSTNDTGNPGATPGQTPSAEPDKPAGRGKRAKVAVPVMTEGTRQEVEVYGRGVDPFTGGIFRKNKDGDVEYFGPGEPDPDGPKA